MMATSGGEGVAEVASTSFKMKLQRSDLKYVKVYVRRFLRRNEHEPFAPSAPLPNFHRFHATAMVSWQRKHDHQLFSLHAISNQNAITSFNKYNVTTVVKVKSEAILVEMNIKIIFFSSK